MRLGNRFELALDIAAVTLSATVGTLILGRFLNSDTVVSLSHVPIIGNITDSLRAALNQTFDVAGND